MNLETHDNFACTLHVNFQPQSCTPKLFPKTCKLIKTLYNKHQLNDDSKTNISTLLPTQGETRVVIGGGGEEVIGPEGLHKEVICENQFAQVAIEFELLAQPNIFPLAMTL